MTPAKPGVTNGAEPKLTCINPTTSEEEIEALLRLVVDQKMDTTKRHSFRSMQETDSKQR